MSTRHLTVDVSEESLDLLQRSVRQGNYASPDEAVDALLMQPSLNAILERPPHLQLCTGPATPPARAPASTPATQRAHSAAGEPRRHGLHTKDGSTSSTGVG